MIIIRKILFFYLDEVMLFFVFVYFVFSFRFRIYKFFGEYFLMLDDIYEDFELLKGKFEF